MLGAMAEVCQIIFNLNREFLLRRRQSCRVHMIAISQAISLRQAEARQARLTLTCQCDFAELELARSLPYDRLTTSSLISASVASGEVAGLG